MNYLSAAERLKDCARGVIALDVAEGYEISAVLECAGMVSDMTPVDLKGLQNIWGGKKIDGDNNAFCYDEAMTLYRNYPDLISLTDD